MTKRLTLGVAEAASSAVLINSTARGTTLFASGSKVTSDAVAAKPEQPE